MDDPHRYDDMLRLPHYRSDRHPHMSLYNRAAQFSPFAALTGYGAKIHEAARLTDRRIELSEDDVTAINEKLRFLQEHIQTHPSVELTYFLPDAHKDGGSYATVSGTVKKLDPYRKLLLVQTDTGVISVPMHHISSLKGRCFSAYFSEA